MRRVVLVGFLSVVPGLHVGMGLARLCGPLATMGILPLLVGLIWGWYAWKPAAPDPGDERAPAWGTVWRTYARWLLALALLFAVVAHWNGPVFASLRQAGADLERNGLRDDTPPFGPFFSALLEAVFLAARSGATFVAALWARTPPVVWVVALTVGLVRCHLAVTPKRKEPKRRDAVRILSEILERR